MPIPTKYMRYRSIPAAVSAYSEQQKAATDFIKFLTSKQAQDIFAKHGYPIKPPKLAASGKQK